MFVVSMLALTQTAVAQTLAPIHLTLDWKTQGHHSMFYIAKEKGYFQKEGLDVTIDQGDGSSGVISRVMSGSFDAGYGDMNTVIEQAALRPDAAPVMVYMFQYRAPFTLAVPADGPIKSLSDLPGKTIGSSAGSAAFRLFPVLGRVNRVDLATTKVTNVQPSMQEQLLIKGEIDGVLNYSSTTYMNLYLMKKDPAKDFRWFDFYDNGMDLYANGILVSRKLAQEKPEAVRGLLRALNQGFRDMVNDPDAAIALLVRGNPMLDGKVEKLRMNFIFKNLYRSSEYSRIGFGDVEDARLTRSIGVLKEAFNLPRVPSSSEVFDRSFLPARNLRTFAF